MSQEQSTSSHRTFRIGRIVVNISVLAPVPRKVDPRKAARPVPARPVRPAAVVAAAMPAITSRKQLIGYVVGCAAIVCMVISGYEFRWIQGQIFTYPNTGVVLAALSAVLVLAALFLLGPKAESFEVAPRTTRIWASRINWRLVLLSTLALFIVGESGRNLLLKFALPTTLQVILLVLGTLGVCWGFGALRDSFSRLRNFRLRDFKLKNISRTTLILLAITIFGFGIRLWHIDNTVRIMIDEESDYHAINVLNDQPTISIFQPLMYGPANYSYLYPFLTRITSALPVGYDLTGPRLGSVLIGGLTVPAMYLLGEALFDDVIGLIAAALMAAFPVAIHFSRLAIPNITDPLFGTLAIAFLARGFRRNFQSDFVLAGAFLALSGFFYEGGRFVFFGTFVLFILLVLITRRPWWQRRGLVLMVLTGLLVAMPYYYALSKYDFAPRTTSEVVRPGYILRDLKTKPAVEVFTEYWNDALSRTLFHTIYSPDSSQFYYGGFTGILLWYMVPFYLLGLFFALWRFRYVRWILWGWLVASILGISFIVATDWTARFMLMFPAMMLAAAIGLRYGVEWILLPFWKIRWPKYAVMAALVVGLGAAEVYYYFHDHLPIYNVQIRGLSDFYEAFERARTFSAAEIVYVSDQWVFTPVLDTMLEFDHVTMKYDVWKPTEATPDKMLVLPRDKTIIFAIRPGDDITPRLLQAFVGVMDGPLLTSDPTVPPAAQFYLYLYKPRGKNELLF